MADEELTQRLLQFLIIVNDKQQPVYRLNR
jgi:hypothetical protein